MGMQDLCLPIWMVGILLMAALGRPVTRGFISARREEQPGRTRDTDGNDGTPGKSETNEIERKRP
jgi:hypothetical protein